MINRRRYGYLILFASIVFVVVATVYPFNFVVSPWSLPNSEYASWSDIFSKFEDASSIKDYWRNVWFFMPFGIGLAWVLATTKLKLRSIVLITLVASFSLSLMVETLQVFLPVRVPNITDLITNTVGGVLGVYLFWYQDALLNLFSSIIFRDRSRLTAKSLAAIFSSYFILVFMAILVLLLNVNLKNWDENFRLIIGNELDAPRPWQGYINELAIVDRALSEMEVTNVLAGNNNFWNNLNDSVAAYDFKSQDKFYVDRFNNSEPLVWQGNNFTETSKLEIDRGALLNNNQGTCNNEECERWLVTQKPVFNLIEQLEKTNEFTVNTIIATNNLEQTGPARILSLSKSSFHRNLTLGQDKSSLVLRLRTPVSGDNGTEPELILPNVFNDRESHHLLVTFKRNELNVYIDRVDNRTSFRFVPEITFLSYFPLAIKFWSIDISQKLKLIYPLTFYTVVCLPLGFLGGLWLSLLKNDLFKLLLTGSICVLPAVIIEQFYVMVSGNSVRIFYLLLSISLLSAATLITQFCYGSKLILNKKLLKKV
jgi:glycopeptide antibiotics resistance protein